MKKQGFSLVELLVSIMVISIIAVAFAPIVTKRIQGSIVTKAQQNGQNASEEGQDSDDEDDEDDDANTGHILFTLGSKGCGKVMTDSTTKGRYVKCTFQVPKNVEKINVVAVGSGSGGGGGINATTYRFPKDYFYYRNIEMTPGDTFSFDFREDIEKFHYFDYAPLELQLDIRGGGGAGGYGKKEQEFSYYRWKLCGGGGSSGGSSGPIDIPVQIQYYNGTASLYAMDFIVGKGGVRTTVNEVVDGQSSYAKLTYCYPKGFYNSSWNWPGVDASGCFMTQYEAYGGLGGDDGYQTGYDAYGGKPGLARIVGTFTEPTLNPDQTYSDASNQCYYGGYFSGPHESFPFGCMYPGKYGTGRQYYCDGGKGGCYKGRSYSPRSEYVSCGGDGGAGDPENPDENYSGEDGKIILKNFQFAYSIYRALGNSSGAGVDGDIVHYTNLDVIPGEICYVTVGLGGLGGANAQNEIGTDWYHESYRSPDEGAPGYYSEIKCNTMGRASWIQAKGYSNRYQQAHYTYLKQVSEACSCDLYGSYDNCYNECKNAQRACVIPSGVNKDDIIKIGDTFVKLALNDLFTNTNDSKTLTKQEGNLIYLKNQVYKPECASYSSTYAGAIGGNGHVATDSSKVVCGGMAKDSGCNNFSPEAQIAEFKAPTVSGVKNKKYGSAGGGGAGGGWDSATNISGKGGDGQNGYVFIYWDEE